MCIYILQTIITNYTIEAKIYSIINEQDTNDEATKRHKRAARYVAVVAEIQTMWYDAYTKAYDKSAAMCVSGVTGTALVSAQNDRDFFRSLKDNVPQPAIDEEGLISVFLQSSQP